MAKTRADIQAQIDKLQAEMNAIGEKKKDILMRILFTDDFITLISNLSDFDLKLLADYIQEKSKDYVNDRINESKIVKKIESIN